MAVRDGAVAEAYNRLMRRLRGNNMWREIRSQSRHEKKGVKRRRLRSVRWRRRFAAEVRVISFRAKDGVLIVCCKGAEKCAARESHPPPSWMSSGSRILYSITALYFTFFVVSQKCANASFRYAAT